MDLEHIDRDRRRTLLTALLGFTILCSAIFFAITLVQGHRLVALANAVVGLLFLGLLVATCRSERVFPVALVSLLLLCSLLVVVTAAPETSPTAIVWIPVLVTFCYALLGPRSGLRLGLLFFAVSGAAIYVKVRTLPESVDPAVIADATLPALVTIAFFHFWTLSRQHTDRDLLHKVFRDPLTALANRDKLEIEFEREQRRARRSGAPLSLILIDLDHFKVVNDRYGHDVGDAALVFVAELLQHRVRATDLLSRLGGEEFVVLLPDTDATGAVKVADDLRATLEAEAFHYQGNDIRLTLSAGVVELGRHGDSWLQLYRAADARLYASKRHGRNRVMSRLPAETAER